MERGRKTGFILKQFKRKSKRAINKDFYTEFFYLNKSRGVIEFLSNEKNELYLQKFFKEFLPEEFKSFIDFKILSDNEEEIRNWYYLEENLVLVLKVNWGIKKQEISLEIDSTNFLVTVINEDETFTKNINYTLLNDFIISFVTNQARILSETFDKLSLKPKKSLSKKN